MPQKVDVTFFSPTSLASPKSAILTVGGAGDELGAPDELVRWSRMFSGLRSRCTMPSEWQ